MHDGSEAHRRVEPSTSVNRNTPVPTPRTLPTAYGVYNHLLFDPSERPQRAAS
jgi:hypothetical protein